MKSILISLRNCRHLFVPLLCSACLLCVGCGKNSIDGAPLPKNFGAYAASNSQMIQLNGGVLSTELSPTVTFLVFAKDVALGAGELPLAQVPLQAESIPSQGGSVLDNFLRTVMNQANMAEEALGGVPVRSVRIVCNSAPVEGHADMLTIKPTVPLPSGLYFFAKTRFWVKKEEFVRKLRSTTTADIVSRNWQSAVSNARTVLQVVPDDGEMRTAIGAIYDGLLTDAAKASRQAQWKEAEDLARAAVQVQPDREAAKNFLLNLPFDRAMTEGNAALKTERWGDAVASFTEAKTMRPQDPTVASLLRTTSLGYQNARYLAGKAQQDPELVISAAKQYLCLSNNDSKFSDILRQGFYDRYLAEASRALKEEQFDAALDASELIFQIRPADQAATEIKQRAIEHVRSDPNYYGRQFVRKESSPDGLPDIIRIQLTPDQKTYIVQSDESAFMWARGEGKFTQRFRGVSECLVSPNRKLTLFTLNSGHANVMYNESGVVLWNKATQIDQIRSAFTPDSNHVLVAVRDKLYLLDARTGQQHR